MPSDDVIAELQALHTKWTQEAYLKGIVDGRKQEREAIIHLIDMAPMPDTPVRGRPRRERIEPHRGVTNDQIFAYVGGALRELEEDNPQGVFPDIVADLLRKNPPDGNGLDLKVPQVRAALRTMTLTGQARRAARGKYLPMPIDTPTDEDAR